jgi:hypothetical protein
MRLVVIVMLAVSVAMVVRVAAGRQPKSQRADR